MWIYGEVLKWSKRRDSKSRRALTRRVGSNPTFSARKKHTFVYQDNVCFFQRKLPLRASEIALLWNIRFANVGKFHFTSNRAAGGVRYFTISNSKGNYFTFGRRRICHLKNLQFYDIITAERRCLLWKQKNNLLDGRSINRTRQSLHFCCIFRLQQHLKL